MRGMLVVIVCLVTLGTVEAQRRERPKAQHRIEKNVVYGMYSGLALLMDVHHPDNPNGYGVIHVSGSGWTAPLSVDARQLKHSSHVRIEAWPLVKAGYTVFSINHRAAPRFHFPAPVEDARRAVRFVRSKAADYGIDADRIGAMGGSSGGHLVSMLALGDGNGDPTALSPIDRVSAKVQCVAARAVPVEISGSSSLLLLGYRVMDRHREGSVERESAVAASPISHVSADDPPMLLLHGDSDPVVPIEGARRLKAELEEAGVTVELIEIEGAGHGPGFRGGKQEVGAIYANAVRWMDTHLKVEK